MRTLIATLGVVAILFWSFCGEGLAQSGGMFGPRVTGGSLQPGRSSQFNNGLHTAPNGTFVGAGRTSGPAMFATPWRQVNPWPTLYPAPVYTLLPNGQTAIVVPGELSPPAATTPASVAPATATQPEAAAPPQAAGEGPAPAAGEAATPAAGDSTYVAPSPPTVHLVTARMVAAGEAGGYLPGVSARLTRIARDRGMATPSGIRVSLLNGTAILRGEVGTPHDRSLIGNMAGLEPGIWRVSNELTIAAQAPPAGAAAK